MKLWIVAFILAIGSLIHGAPMTMEAPIRDYGTPTTVSISTSAWTMVPTTSTTGRIGIYVDVPATANASMVAHIGNCTSTAVATTVRPIEIVKGEQSSYFPLRDDVCLWVLSLHSAAESLHYQEVKK